MDGNALLQLFSFIYASLIIVLLSFLIDLLRRILLDSAASFTSSSTTAIVCNKQTGVSYRGIAVSGVEHFQNIFYAEDTSGNNLFAPPVPSLPAPSVTVSQP